MSKENLKDFEKDIINMYKEGKSLREIGTIYDVHYTTIKRLLKDKVEFRKKVLFVEMKKKFTICI